VLDHRGGRGRPNHGGDIHVAPATTTGPVVVPLNPYAGGCTDVERELALAIITSPESYYVNVHNAPYPAGALRGQLVWDWLAGLAVVASSGS
jgi:hypothetical protein